jgi:hypothetical protein
MLVVRTIEDSAHPLGKLVCPEYSIGLHHLALAVDPFRFDGLKPRTLLRKKATYDPHSTAAVLDAAVVRSEPPPDLLGDVPGGIVPDEEQDLLTKTFLPRPSYQDLLTKTFLPRASSLSASPSSTQGTGSLWN